MAVTSGKAIDAAYLLKQLQNFDSQILENKYNLIFQYATLPEASADVKDRVFQYIGETNETYVNGYFYKCIESSGDDGSSYSYVAVTQSAPEYTIAKDDTASEGAAATYHLTKDGVNVGAAIDIPKDFFLSDASFGLVTSDDIADGGKFSGNSDYAVGDAYLELDVNVVDGDSTTVKPIYVNVKNLVDTYTAGDGITITSNEVAVVLDADGGLVFKANTDGKNEVAIDFETEDIDFSSDWA